MGAAEKISTPATPAVVLSRAESALSELFGTFNAHAYLTLKPDELGAAQTLLARAMRETAAADLVVIRAASLLRMLHERADDEARGGDGRLTAREQLALVRGALGADACRSLGLENEGPGTVGAPGLHVPPSPELATPATTTAATLPGVGDVGGERGIRTPDTLAGTPDFEEASPAPAPRCYEAVFDRLRCNSCMRTAAELGFGLNAKAGGTHYTRRGPGGRRAARCGTWVRS